MYTKVRRASSSREFEKSVATDHLCTGTKIPVSASHAQQFNSHIQEQKQIVCAGTMPSWSGTTRFDSPRTTQGTRLFTMVLCSSWVIGCGTVRGAATHYPRKRSNFGTPVQSTPVSFLYDFAPPEPAMRKKSFLGDWAGSAEGYGNFPCSAWSTCASFVWLLSSFLTTVFRMRPRQIGCKWVWPSPLRVTRRSTRRPSHSSRALQDHEGACDPGGPSAAALCACLCDPGGPSAACSSLVPWIFQRPRKIFTPHSGTIWGNRGT